MTFTASGSVTNIASRLSDYAKGGDILIGEETWKMIQGLWPTHSLGRIHLKGLKEPVPVYSLLRPQT
jgi:class 3 adenylate cyclase